MPNAHADGLTSPSPRSDARRRVEERYPTTGAAYQTSGRQSTASPALRVRADSGSLDNLVGCRFVS